MSDGSEKIGGRAIGLYTRDSDGARVEVRPLIRSKRSIEYVKARRVGAKAWHRCHWNVFLAEHTLAPTPTEKPAVPTEKNLAFEEKE